MFLTVILVDTFITRMAINHLNEYRPYVKRVVKIRLTDDQIAKIKPHIVGSENGKEALEEIFECFLEEMDQND